MAVLEIRPEMMPGLVREISDLVGPALALRFARKFGGRKVYFPQRMYSTHPIAQCVGPKAAQLISAHFAGSELVVPSCKSLFSWFEARALCVFGLNNNEIAAKLDLTSRWVTKLLEGFDPATVEMTDPVRQTGRRYGVAGKRSGDPQTRTQNRPQADFGFPADARGFRLTEV